MTAHGDHPGSVRATGARRRGWITAVVALAVVLAGFVGMWALIATKPTAPQRPTAERAKPVDAVAARPADIAPLLVAHGRIVAGRTVDLRGHVAGEVLTVGPNLAEGGLVAAGETLLIVDPFAYEGALVKARAELAEAEARVVETAARIVAERDAARRSEEQREISRRELDRVSNLSSRGNASAADLDSARTRLSAAAAAAEARVNQIPVLEAQERREAAALDRLRFAVRSAERDLGHTRLVAPFAGVLSGIAVEQGKIINATDRVATLTDLDRLEARFSLPDAQFARFVTADAPLEGRPAQIIRRGGALDPDEAVLPAVIGRIAPSVAADSGGVDVFARIEAGAAAALRLRPGAFIEARLNAPPLTGVLRLPQSALYPGDLVYHIDGDSRLRPTPASPLAYEGADVLLRAEIPPGASVLATRLSEAAPGLLVAVRGEQP